MARYVIDTGMGGTPQNMTTTYKTLLSLHAVTGATTLRRAFIYDVMIAPDGTPADNVMVYKIDTQTAAGTATTITPRPLYRNDAAALITANANHTAEPTITDNTELLEVPCNQRATFRWVASQEGELVVPAVNLEGLGLRAKSPAYASTMVANMHFKE